MRGLIVAAFFAVFFAFSQAAEAQVVFPDQSKPLPIKVPRSIGADGGFHYDLPIEVPDFRGLQPSLSFQYDSSNNGRGSAQTWLGIGWRLSGISTIDRSAMRGGLPTFSDNDDIFRLDGSDLMACVDAALQIHGPSIAIIQVNSRLIPQVLAAHRVEIYPNAWNTMRRL